MCFSPGRAGHVQQPTAAPESQRLSIGYLGMYAMGAMKDSPRHPDTERQNLRWVSWRKSKILPEIA